MTPSLLHHTPAQIPEKYTQNIHTPQGPVLHVHFQVESVNIYYSYWL